MQLETRHAFAIGRSLMALIFLVAGVRKALTYAATAAYFAKLGIPAPEIVLALTIVLEIGGAVALIIGWRLPLVAGALGLFTIAAAFLGHAFWAVDPAQFQAQLNNFLKNVAMAGGFLVVAAAARKEVV
ncbi:DoxX family protein [Aquabacterium sp.]|uniref:DoxX family protein n=1 Tax=Aquabacterium sp. TaxID=1872578 RepID=UPI002B80DE7F|nr:DoxX family protein [Aquabacterium sp.]HSW05634.1 DoxX family protein [Aquabacterium sp.]